MKPWEVDEEKSYSHGVHVREGEWEALLDYAGCLHLWRHEPAPPGSGLADEADYMHVCSPADLVGKIVQVVRLAEKRLVTYEGDSLAGCLKAAEDGAKENE